MFLLLVLTVLACSVLGLENGADFASVPLQARMANTRHMIMSDNGITYFL
jgi:hypothetical protein